MVHLSQTAICLFIRATVNGLCLFLVRYFLPRIAPPIGAVSITPFRHSPRFLLLALALSVSLVWAFYPSDEVDAMPHYMKYRIDHFNERFEQSLWPAYMRDKVMSVAMCESSLRWYISGDQGRAVGYMQIRKDYHPKKSQVFDLHEDNLTVAYIIYLEAGRSWDPWSCKP